MNAPLNQCLQSACFHLFSTLLSRVTNWQCSPRTCTIRGSPKKGGHNQNWRGPQVGGNATSPLHSQGSPTKGTKSKWAQVGGNATSPLHSLGSPTKGTKSKWAQVGGNATSSLHSRESPKKGGQNQNWMPNPCLLGGPQVGGNATSPLNSRGSPTKGTKSKQKKSKKKTKTKIVPWCL